MKKGADQYLSKADLDRLIAAKLGVKPNQVHEITAQLFHEMMLQLVKGRGIAIPGFGQLWMQSKKPTPCPVHLKKGTFKKGEAGVPFTTAPTVKHHVHFAKGSIFKRLVLEKYGKAKINKENDHA